jgi:SAM-dependent methyltransferase
MRSRLEDAFMATSVFGLQYADQYDLLYHDKDYEAECDLLEEVFQRYAQGSVETVLDLGCGTGNHAIPLSRRGYQIVGVDRSADMLSHAREKIKANFLTQTPEIPIFIEGDVRSVDVGQQFDAVLMMFAVLGYQLTNQDVSAALGTVQKHLKPGGLFVCDVWYGPAVLAIRPSERVKVIPTEEGKLIRVASGILNIYQHLCEVRYQLRWLSGNQVVSEAEESHQMRYFFPQELSLFLNQAQMDLVNIRAFEGLDIAPSENTWNVLVIGKSW